MATNVTSHVRSMATCFDGSAIAVSFGLAETITWSVISVITVFGTVFSICRLSKDIHRLPDHNFYVLSLLASDFCIGIAAHTTLAYATHKVKVPCIMAKIVESVTFFSVIVSLSSSLVVAINRNRALDIKHSRVLNRIQRNALNVLKLPSFIVSLIWLCSLVLTLVVALKRIDFAKFKALFGILCILIIAANCRLLFKLRRLNARVHARSNANVILHRVQQQLAVRVVNAVTITLFLTTLPAIIVSLLIRTGVFIGVVGTAIAYKLVFLGPAIDPIMYVAIYYILK